MYLATRSGIKLAGTMKTLVVSIKIFKDDYIAKFCLEIPSDVLLSEHYMSSTPKHVR